MSTNPAEALTLGGTSLGPLNLVGRLVGRDADENPIYETITHSLTGSPHVPQTPDPPALASTQPARTQVNLSWIESGGDAGQSPLSAWEVEARVSTDNGAVFGAWTAVSGSPFSPATLTLNRTGLSSGTPEHIFEHQVRGVNADGAGGWSNVRRDQWLTASISPPTAPTNLALGVATTTSQAFTWAATTDTTVTHHRLVEGAAVVVPNIAADARSYAWTGLATGSVHNNVGIQRANLASDGVTIQWSPVSNRVSFDLPDAPPINPELLPGCSDSDNDHGSPTVDVQDLNWPLWRVYSAGRATTIANRTGAQRPVMLFVSLDGPNLGDANPVYNTVFNQVLDVLNTFYYTTPTGQVHTGRWGIRYYFSNGNENHDKGALTGNTGPGSLTAQQIANYVTSQRALWEAVHFIDPTTTQRRFPNAYAGSNPVHEAEIDNKLEQYLTPSAQWHDFIMWSSYPPGRQTTNTDPTYNWPSTNLADRTNRQLGYQVRCFYRTVQTRIAKRTALADQTADMEICVGEWGIGDDPEPDSTTRPYFAVHGLMWGWYRNCQLHGFQSPGACWWDQMKKLPGGAWDDSAPENLLSTGRDNAAALRRHEPTNTNPSTADAYRNWRTYCHAFGGSHPASWAGNPKAVWKTTGSVI